MEESTREEHHVPGLTHPRTGRTVDRGMVGRVVLLESTINFLDGQSLVEAQHVSLGGAAQVLVAQGLDLRPLRGERSAQTRPLLQSVGSSPDRPSARRCPSPSACSTTCDRWPLSEAELGFVWRHARRSRRGVGVR